jgi:hypothetical protein
MMTWQFPAIVGTDTDAFTVMAHRSMYAFESMFYAFGGLMAVIVVLWFLLMRQMNLRRIDRLNAVLVLNSK